LYPSDGIPNYPQEKFIEDLVKESVTDIRGCLDQGAHCVQIDFTEGSCSQTGPIGTTAVLFIALINRVLDQFNDEERMRYLSNPIQSSENPDEENLWSPAT
jgi:5-methyltetrahydropteroyltriglutamate--homocysteine methyltransferase